MKPIAEPTPEEMKKLLEKAQRELQEKLDKMTPEERAQWEQNAQRIIEADRISMEEQIEQARKVAAGFSSKARPKFCTNCGAPLGSGKFCSNCGSPIGE